MRRKIHAHRDEFISRTFVGCDFFIIALTTIE